MASVRVVSVDRVGAPSPGPAVVPLAFFDTFWISLPPIQRLFLYPETSGLPFASVVSSLKSSLSKTFLNFHPFAGKLTYLPSSADVIIDCTNTGGVAFIEAESDGDIDLLAGAPIHDSESFIGLVPELEMEELPMPLMAVQVTGFGGGGVAVGVAIHHTVADGKGVWQFMDAWAATCRGEGEEAVSVPVHDRAVIRHSRGEEIARRFLKDFSPDLPQMSAHVLSMEYRLSLQRRTFILSSSAVQSLKQRLISRSDGPDRPSIFTAISAHAWICIARANAASSTDASDVSTLIFLADGRSRLQPPLPSSYTGNCVSVCYATSTWADLLGPAGLSRAQAEVARAARETTRDPLKRCETWAEDFKRLPEAGRVFVSGSPRFRVYETDFGWGRPGRVELVSMNKDGEVVLVQGREPGLVQVSVALDPIRMEVFAEAFVDGLEA